MDLSHSQHKKRRGTAKCTVKRVECYADSLQAADSKKVNPEVLKKQLENLEHEDDAFLRKVTHVTGMLQSITCLLY